MKFHTLLPTVGCLLLLSACATDGASSAASKLPTSTIDQVMGEAAAVAKAGQYDKSLQMLKGATSAFPADKAPWLQMAQMKFDRAQYGDAIVNALEVLQRDPDDKVANSIVAVSGLRLSTKALADLTRQNHISASLRSEAQDLSKLLRASLAEEPVPAAAGAKRAPVAKKSLPGGGGGAAAAVGAAAAGVKPASAGADPFSGLK